MLAKPVIGFLINRLQHALLHEAYCLIEAGIVRAEDVDNFAKRLFGPRMCVTGVIEQKDLSGLDIHAASQRGIVPDLYHTNRPSPIVQDLASAGQLGAKTGTGFYDWREVDLAAHRAKAADKLARLLALLEGD